MAALPWLAAVAAGAGAWFAAQSTARAQLTKTLLDASRELVVETQTQHAKDGVLIEERDDRIRAHDLELLRKNAEIRQHLQQRDSIAIALKREQDENKRLRARLARRQRTGKKT